MITGKNYIGNQLSAKGNITFTTYNPEKDIENKTVFVEVSDTEIEEAVALSTQAYKAYQKVSSKAKAIFLDTIANEILNLGDSLIDVYCLESGLTKERAIVERTRTLYQLKTFSESLLEGSWAEASIDINNVDLRKINKPIGPVVVFGASNFPLAYSTAGGDTVSALAAGCPVIVKSHPMHAGTGELVASAIVLAIQKTNMPNGVFSNLNSKGIEVGQKLVLHKDIKAVGFTGSVKGGRALLDLAANRKEPVPVFAEMGSVNPVVLLPNKLEEEYAYWANVYADSITLGAGQFCTNPGLIIGLEGSSFSKFIDKLSEKIKEKASHCMLHPKIKYLFDTGRENIILDDDVKELVRFSSVDKVNYASQSLAITTATNFIKKPKLQEEVFGPFSLIVKCKDIDEVSLVVNSLGGQLTGTIISNPEELYSYESLISIMQSKVGRLIFNGVPTGVTVCSSMVHGGPYPASSDSRFTAVGANAIKRWLRPFSYQNWPEKLLPLELQNKNPLGILRSVNNVSTKEVIKE